MICNAGEKGSPYDDERDNVFSSTSKNTYFREGCAPAAYARDENGIKMMDKGDSEKGPWCHDRIAKEDGNENCCFQGEINGPMMRVLFMYRKSRKYN